MCYCLLLHWCLFDLTNTLILHWPLVTYVSVGQTTKKKDSSMETKAMTLFCSASFLVIFCLFQTCQLWLHFAMWSYELCGCGEAVKVREWVCACKVISVLRLRLMPNLRSRVGGNPGHCFFFFLLWERGLWSFIISHLVKVCYMYLYVKMHLYGMRAYSVS